MLGSYVFQDNKEVFLNTGGYQKDWCDEDDAYTYYKEYKTTNDL